MVELADDASVSRPPSTRGQRAGGPHTEVQQRTGQPPTRDLSRHGSRLVSMIPCSRRVPLRPTSQPRAEENVNG